LFVQDFYCDQFLAKIGAEPLSPEPPLAGGQLPPDASEESQCLQPAVA